MQVVVVVKLSLELPAQVVQAAVARVLAFLAQLTLAVVAEDKVVVLQRALEDLV
jgi:hypothetical protein